MLKQLHNHLVRRAISVALAVLLAFVLSQYTAMSGEPWMVASAFLVSQTTRGTPLRQSVFYFFMLVLIAIVISYPDMQMMQARVFDTVIGSLIGIVFGQLILPVRVYSEFSTGVVPVLRALCRDMNLLHANLLEQIGFDRAMSKQQYRVERALQMRETMYPEWVYEVGFNPGLRSGFRFILINIERIAEIIFSMNYYSSRPLPAEMIEVLRDPLQQVITHNDKLITVLVNYFTRAEFVNLDGEADFTRDMAELEKALTQLVPNAMDLLDISPDYIAATVLVRDLRDMRGLLLQLVMALPTAK